MVYMTELKLVGEFNCRNCGKSIKIDSSVGICDRLVWNAEQKKCTNCNALNIITIDIKLTGVTSKDEI